MDLARLKIFYTLVKSGSFTKAAKALNVSQSAVTHSLQLFEHRIKSKLINRSPKGLTLTPQGEKLYEFAHRVMQEADLISELLNDNKDVPQGKLKILTTPYLASNWIPKKFKNFFKQYPDLHIAIFGELEDLNVGHADIVIRTFMPHHPHIIQNHFYSFRSRLWASPEYLENYGTPQNPEDLDLHRIIAFGGTNKSYDSYGSTLWILNVGNKHAPREPYAVTNSIEGLINLACDGLGIIEAPEEYVNLRTDKLIMVLPHIESPVVETYYSYPKLLKGSSKIKAFENFIKENLHIIKE